MKYLLSHRTSYTYASSVDSAHHIAHLRAREFPGQKVTSISIETNPVPALAVQHLDHFGNHIDIYRIDKPHLGDDSGALLEFVVDSVHDRAIGTGSRDA